MTGFQSFRRDRKGRGGGGVAIYIRDELQANTRSDLSVPNDLELLWVEIRTSEVVTLIGALYHPPHPQYRTYMTVSNSQSKPLR